ncbi:MAG: hypothetical protein SFV23_06570 [Planctomycetaceae bacterium]|nr:hypothetical protein [Planctomycetaceae bacterium]
MLRNVCFLIAAAVVSLTVVSVSLACPFCSAPSLTLTEQLTQSDAVALVKWAGGTPAKGQDAGDTIYEVLEVVKQPDGGKLATGNRVTLVRYRSGTPSDQYLLLGTRGGAVIDWGSPMEVTETSFKYMKEAPKPDVSPAKRMQYFVKFLEHPDKVISDDAYGEFASTAYGDIVQITQEMPREKLREWIVNPEISPSRLGLYGMMLGLCGTADDIPLLEQKIFSSSEEFRLGIDGIMGGYLLLTKDAGLAKLDEEKLKNRKAPFSETYAAMQAIRFMWQYGDGQISADRLRQSMRVLLDRPELADLVIADLARWKDWSVQSQLMELYGAEEYDSPSIKRAVVRFMMASTKDVPPSKEGEPAAELPEHAKLGAKYLAELEQKDPKTVSEAKRFFFLK